MADDPKGMFSHFRSMAWSFCGACAAVWVGLKLLLQVWWVLVLVVALAVTVRTALWWWRSRHW